MKKFAFGAVLLLLAASAVQPQGPAIVVTYPKVPPKETLGRMGLALQWRAQLFVQGSADGFSSVQAIPFKDSVQIVVQTFSGKVALFDGDTGDLLWKTQIGIPYWSQRAAGFDSESIFVTRRNFLHILDRATGAERAYTYNERSQNIEYGYRLPFTPSSAPVADEDAVFIALGARIATIAIPEYELEAKKKPDRKDPPANKRESLQPAIAWIHALVDDTVEEPALPAGNQVSFVTGSGTLLSFNKYENRLRLDFKAFAHVSVPAAKHGMTAYMGGDDGILYAINMDTGGVTWRYLNGTPFTRRPDVSDRHLLVTSPKVGLACIDRTSGRSLWNNTQVNRSLANHPKFVYALDRIGRLHVLDVNRGTSLSAYDISDWTIPVTNEITDRIYLAAHDGQILCLRERDSSEPIRMKNEEPKKKEPKKGKDKIPVEKKDPDAAVEKDQARLAPRTSIFARAAGPAWTARRGIAATNRLDALLP